FRGNLITCPGTQSRSSAARVTRKAPSAVSVRPAARRIDPPGGLRQRPSGRPAPSGDQNALRPGSDSVRYQGTYRVPRVNRRVIVTRLGLIIASIVTGMVLATGAAYGVATLAAPAQTPA